MTSRAPRPHGQRHPRAGHGRGGSRPSPAIPACRWAWPTSPPCCSRRFLKFDPADPTWPDRDRFVLSAGHGSMLLYSLLYLIGYEAMTIERDQELPPARLEDAGPSRKTSSRPASRPPPARSARASPTPSAWRSPSGISRPNSATTSSITRTYVLASDGDLMEGISQEAIALAGHLKLNKLIVLFDDNGISIDGPLSLSDSVDQVERFEAAGWNAVAHRRPRSRRRSPRRSQARRSVRPADHDRLQDHHRLRRADQGRHVEARTARRSAPKRSRARARSSAGRDAPFEIPADVLDAWRAAGQRVARPRARPGTSASPRCRADKRARVRAPHARRPAGRRSTPRCAR